MSDKQHMAPVVSVLNMKGGVGKTTLSANIFRELHYKLPSFAKTLLIDFDAQFNLTQLLTTEKHYEDLCAKGKTIWSILEPNPSVSVFTTSQSNVLQFSSVFEFTEKLESISTTGKELHLLPGDFRLAELNLRENHQDLIPPRKRFRQFIEHARKECALVVLDCNPSSSFLTRCAIESSTHIVVPIRPDKYSILGLKLLSSYIEKVLKLPNSPKLFIVMNGVTKDHSDVESEIRLHQDFGAKVMQTRIKQSKVLIAGATHTGFASDRRGPGTKPIRILLNQAATELQKNLGL